jgi:transposase-like protein
LAVAPLRLVPKTVVTQLTTTRKKVRQHPAALRQQVLMECAQLGASVARVAQSHGLNANMVHVAPAGASRVGRTEREHARRAPARTN